MKRNLVTALVMGVALACVTAVAQGGGGDPKGDQIQQRDRDQLQTCSPTLDQDRTRTRLQDGLPGCVQDAVKEMKQTREQYQEQLRDKIKEQKACTEQDRQQLRTQLREAIKDQVRDREQLRERLQALRESVPSHDQLMEQAREQVQASARRGE
jgi:predicted RNase H-like nuclease (RuvC/YqgF family)